MILNKINLKFKKTNLKFKKMNIKYKIKRKIFKLLTY